MLLSLGRQCAHCLRPSRVPGPQLSPMIISGKRPKRLAIFPILILLPEYRSVSADGNTHDKRAILAGQGNAPRKEPRLACSAPDKGVCRYRWKYGGTYICSLPAWQLCRDANHVLRYFRLPRWTLDGSISAAHRRRKNRGLTSKRW